MYNNNDINLIEHIKLLDPYVINTKDLTKYKIKLDLNENNFKINEDINYKINRKNCYLYSFNDINTKKLLERICYYNNNLITLDNILLTNGADGSLDLISECFINNSKNVLFYYPTYDYFYSLVKKRNGNIILIKDPLKLYNFDLDNINIIYICNPNNPDGYKWDIIKLKKIIMNNPKIVFIIDEAYLEYNSKTILEFINIKNVKNIFIIRTFSKAFSLAGVRLGYMISCKRNINWIRKIYNQKYVTTFAKNVGLLSLSDKNINKIKKNCKEIMKIKLKCEYILESFGIDINFNTGGNYIYFKPIGDTDNIINYFYDNGIIVRKKQNNIRITLSNIENMKEFINTYCNYLINNNFLKKINVIILAAGLGSRFGSENMSKCNAKINNETLLSFKINKLQKNKFIDNIFIITGYCHDSIINSIKNNDKVKFIFNKNYNIENNWKSFLVGLENIDDNNDIILIDGDVIYEDLILKQIICSNKTCLAIDSSSKLDEEGMKIITKNNKIFNLNKKNEINKSYGEFIGLTKISNDDIFKIKNYIKMCSGQDYYEDGFNIFLKNNEMKICDIFNSKWYEIDTREDLENAKKIFNNN